LTPATLGSAERMLRMEFCNLAIVRLLLVKLNE